MTEEENKKTEAAEEGVKDASPARKEAEVSVKTPVEQSKPTENEAEAGDETVPETDTDPFTLSDIKGLGAKKLTELKDAGISDVTDLIGADASEIASKTSISEEKLKVWQKFASSKKVEILADEIADAEKDLAAEKEELLLWEPRTELGRKVKSGEVKTIDEVLSLSVPVKEVEIIDKLLPDLSEEILNVGRVQRVTDSGRRMRFRVVAAVGNGDGYVGIGVSKGKEAGPTIRKAIERAKLHVISVKRGCGSWECGCGAPHTVPFKASGKSGGVEVEISPAPRGVGLVSGDLPKKILSLAGISDAWVHTSGHTRTSLNFSHAIYNALYHTSTVKVKGADVSSLNIVAGSVKKIVEAENV
ncbi:MAG: 30S ribosomal protein S5 [Candidatus Altiarchaeota archaeon]